MPGDLVLVRNVDLKGNHKIADRSEKDIYLLVVMKTNEGVPVYLVKGEHCRGPRKFLYRNLLSSCMALPVSNTKATESSVSNVDGTQSLLDE